MDLQKCLKERDELIDLFQGAVAEYTQIQEENDLLKVQLAQGGGSNVEGIKKQIQAAYEEQINCLNRRIAELEGGNSFGKKRRRRVRKY